MTVPTPVPDRKKASVDRALVLQAAFGAGVALIGVSPFAGLLNFIYAPMITLFAAWLMVFRPKGYIGFIFWVWMLTPLVRRMADYVSGYHVVSIVMIAPLAATLVSVFGLARGARTLPVVVLLPHLLILIVLVYGFLIGAPSAGLVAAVFAFLNWATPIIFALYLLRSPGTAEDKAQAAFSAFVWGLVVVGVYGIYQFFYLPRWDEYWMRMSELGSIGAPAPLMVRVFSTLNGPAILAFFVASSLLIAMTSRSFAKKVPIVPGAITFLLSLVRGAWGGFVLGVITLIAKSDAKRKAAYMVAIVVAALVISPIILNSAIGETVQKRTSTIGNLSQDDSLIARLGIYGNFGNSSTSAVFGLGLGNTGDVSSRLGAATQNSATNVIDSGLLEIISNFGVVSIFMIAAVISLMFSVWRSAGAGQSGATAAAVAIASASQFALANPFFGPAAMCFYPFAALALLFGIESGALQTKGPRRRLAGPVTSGLGLNK